MKLLIVEDERVTRENLASMLDFENLGISEVLTASNGERGLKEAMQQHPDILLTDIRMPRMDGIALASHIRSCLPNCRIIFLSAYAELEYYRAAIRLKTVSYLEKPVVPDELAAVLSEAVEECRQLRLIEVLKNQERGKKRRDFALTMTQPKKADESWGIKDVPGYKKGIHYVTSILLYTAGAGLYEELLEELAEWAVKETQEVLFAKKKEDCYVIQLLTKENRNKLVQSVCEKLRNMLSGEYGWYLSCGDTVLAGQSYQSYQNAALGLHRCFYEPYGFIVYPEMQIHMEGSDAEYQEDRQRLLEAADYFSLEDMQVQEQQLYEKLQKEKRIPAGNVRGIYYDFINFILREGEKRQIPEDILAEYRIFLHGGMLDRKNCMEIHEIYGRLLGEIGGWIEEQAQERSRILLIRKYVEDHCHNPQISLREIADYAHLSVSHMCVVFKEQTGTTINQYLTEARMEKAKKYLADPRYNIREISVMSGYQDSNYFGRIFKKTFQMTPVEYREHRRDNPC